jgi:CBS domain-containing protein
MAYVKDFMTKKPQTVSPDSKVSDAVKVMAEKEIGSLIVLEKGKMKGILTERDLLSKVLDAGKNPDNTTVSSAMSSMVAEVRPGISLKKAAETMTQKKGRLVVIENGKPEGIVTAADVVRAIYELGSAFDPSKTITRKVVTVNPETSVRDVVGIMSRKRVGSVVVAKNGKPIGIFTERDLVKKVLNPHVSMDKQVGEVATRQLIIARNETDGRGAAAIMASNGIKRLLLFKGDDMAGVITARDLVEAYAMA